MTKISALASYITELRAEEAVAQRADDSDHDAALTSERFDTERRILEAEPHSADDAATILEIMLTRGEMDDEAMSRVIKFLRDSWQPTVIL